MSSVLIKDKVLEEIDLIPEDKLADLYDFIHYFRLGVEKSQRARSSSLLAFAGCWQDMPDDEFTAFTEEIAQRRHQAFSRRRNNENGTG